VCPFLCACPFLWLYQRNQVSRFVSGCMEKVRYVQIHCYVLFELARAELLSVRDLLGDCVWSEGTRSVRACMLMTSTANQVMIGPSLSCRSRRSCKIRTSTFNIHLEQERHPPSISLRRTKHKQAPWKTKASDALRITHRQKSSDPRMDPKSCTIPISLSLPQVTCMPVYKQAQKQDYRDKLKSIQA
jgi:hypothetical protein